jgi:hypothetical protein
VVDEECDVKVSIFNQVLLIRNYSNSAVNTLELKFEVFRGMKIILVLLVQHSRWIFFRRCITLQFLPSVWGAYFPPPKLHAIGT